MLGSRYDPVYTDFTAPGTKPAPEIRPGRAFRDPFLGIRPTDTLELAGNDRGEPLTDARFGLRRSLLRQFDQARHEWDTQGSPATLGHFQQSAFALLATGKLRDALDYTREPARVREAYGM